MAWEGSAGEATAVIRVERLRIASPEENMLELALLTSMYLGDRWEYLFAPKAMISLFAPTVARTARCRTLPSYLARQRSVDLP